MERCEAVHVFARYPERLAAGRQDVDVRRTAEKRRRQAGRRVDDVLAIVEHQQQPAVPERGDQARKRIFGADFQTEHGRDRARHQPRVAERRQIDQPDAVLISADQPLGDGEGDRGLADAAGPDDRHQALVRELCDKRCHDFLAADHPSCREREIVRRRRRNGRGRRGPRRLLMAYRRDEIVAASDNGRDVAIVALSVAEGTTQRADLDLQIRFFH